VPFLRRKFAARWAGFLGKDPLREQQDSVVFFDVSRPVRICIFVHKMKKE